MRRQDYERPLNNTELSEVIAKIEQLSDFFNDMARIASAFALTGQETLRTRRSVAQLKTPVDWGEFLKHVEKTDPQAAEKLAEAEVLRFDFGRIHLRFKTDSDKAAFGWHRHTLERLSEKLYGKKFGVIIKQSVMPY